MILLINLAVKSYHYFGRARGDMRLKVSKQLSCSSEIKNSTGNEVKECLNDGWSGLCEERKVQDTACPSRAETIVAGPALKE